MAALNKKNPSILNLTNLLDTKVRISLTGGRLIIGRLRGYDQLVNIVLDEAVEKMRDVEGGDFYALNGMERTIGLCVCRGTQVCLVQPVEGREEIENPFVDNDDDEEEEEEGEEGEGGGGEA